MDEGHEFFVLEVRQEHADFALDGHLLDGLHDEGIVLVLVGLDTALLGQLVLVQD